MDDENLKIKIRKISDQEKEERAERLVNYANRTNDMRQIKTQQWLIVYYCSLLFAGIIGISSVIDDLGSEGMALLFILSLINALFGIFVLSRNQIILRNDRIETLRMENKFFTGRDYHIKPIKPIYVTYWFHWQYWLMFKVAIIIGFLLTILYFLEKVERREDICFYNGLIQWSDTNERFSLFEFEMDYSTISIIWSYFLYSGQT